MNGNLTKDRQFPNMRRQSKPRQNGSLKQHFRARRLQGPRCSEVGAPLTPGHESQASLATPHCRAEAFRRTTGSTL